MTDLDQIMAGFSEEQLREEFRNYRKMKLAFYLMKASSGKDPWPVYMNMVSGFVNQFSDIVSEDDFIGMKVTKTGDPFFDSGKLLIEISDGET